MKKKTIVVLCVLSVFFVLIMLVDEISKDKSLLVSGYESFYIEEPSTHNLYKLCKELYGYTDYEKILKYYPMYIENDVAYNFFMESENNEFLAKQHVDSFRLDYSFALLHTSNYTKFKNEFLNLRGSLSNDSFIYYYLAAEIQTRQYTNEQLFELLEILKEMENGYLINSKGSLLSNLSIQAYIYDLLNDTSARLTTIKRIETLESQQIQSGDGSVIDTEKPFN